MGSEILFKELSYKIIGHCMEVHSILGKGFSEAVYKDALEYDFNYSGIHFQREKNFKIYYKSDFLRHNFIADFVIEDNIILEVKAVSNLTDSHIKQTLNYLAASGLTLALLINFGEDSLSYRRVLL